MMDALSSPLFPFREFFATLSFALGACIGSFLNVCIYRIPRGLSVVAPRSYCPGCNKPIPWYNNIPILTWLFLRGKSSCCHTRITSRYVIVESITAVLFLLVWLKFDGHPGPRPLLLAAITDWKLIPVYWLIISGLILGTFVDFEHLIIPDRVTIGGMYAGAFFSLLMPHLHGERTMLLSLAFSVLGMAVGAGILYGLGVFGTWVFKKDAMGFGDVKLLGAIGAFLGTRAVLFTIFFSSLVGSIAGLLMITFKCRTMKSRIPYGPYIAFAAVVWILWGPAIWNAYLNILMPPDAFDPVIISPAHLGR